MTIELDIFRNSMVIVGISGDSLEFRRVSYDVSDACRDFHMATTNSRAYSPGSILRLV